MILVNKKRGVSRRRFLKYAAPSILVIGGLAGWFGSKLLRHEQKSEIKNYNEIGEGLLENKYMLPFPKFTSGVIVEEAMAWRRSRREYKDGPITIEHLSKLLWAAQGINELGYRFRTTPSAGATYPLEVYVVISNNGVMIDETHYLPAGSCKYDYKDHSIELIKEGDLKEELAGASLNQEWVRKAPINIVICAVYERTTKRYGDRGYRYVHMEDGHVGQNIYLMAAAINLGTVAIGAFYDDEVRNVIGAEVKEEPLYVMPVGIPKQPYRISEKEMTEYYESVRQSE